MNLLRRLARRGVARHIAVASSAAFGLGLVALFALAAWRARLVTVEPSLLVRDRDGRFLAEVGTGPGAEAGFWPVRPLPPRVVATTLAIEDRRFFTHPGVDPVAALRALSQAARTGRRVSGASTVAMQVARMQQPGPRTCARKVVEAATALILTARYGRNAVLSHYLRIVPYGNRVHGIRYAARRYLDKPVEDLTWAEAAFLAAIPQAPGRMNPFDPEGRRAAAVRAERILDLLRQRSAITREEWAEARQQLVRLRIPASGRRPEVAMHAVLRLENLLSDPVARTNLQDRLVVVSTLDLDLQERVAWLTLSSMDRWEAAGAGNAAVIVLARDTAEVLAWVGSADYFDERHAGAIDYARVERSPGSALKPFVYALALERGVITPATVLDDLGRGPDDIDELRRCLPRALLPRAALGNSRNVPAADLLRRVGLDDAFALLGDAGLHDGSRPARTYGLGLSVGAMPVTLESLVRAYTTLATDGRRHELRWWRGQQVAAPRRLLSEDTAREITLWLADPQARLPTFPRMGACEYDFPVAVKTGTSSGYRDAWAVAYSTRYLVGVWVGHPDCRSMPELSGFRSAAKLAQGVLVGLHRDEADGFADVQLPPPRAAAPLRVCALTGGRGQSACNRVVLEWFLPGSEPHGACTAHVRMAVDVADGTSATPWTPRDRVEVRTFVDLPPRYAAWAAAAGLPRRAAGAEPHRLARASDDASPRVRVTSPQDGSRLLADPDVPAELATLALEAVVDPPAEQVVWYVDGAPWKVADYPYTARWPLSPGRHTFEARLATSEAGSRRVRISVQ